MSSYAIAGATAVLFYAEPTRVNREHLRKILTTHAISAEIPNDV